MRLEDISSYEPESEIQFMNIFLKKILAVPNLENRDFT